MTKKKSTSRFTSLHKLFKSTDPIVMPMPNRRDVYRIYLTGDEVDLMKSLINDRLGIIASFEENEQEITKAGLRVPLKLATQLIIERDLKDKAEKLLKKIKRGK